MSLSSIRKHSYGFELVCVFLQGVYVESLAFSVVLRGRDLQEVGPTGGWGLVGLVRDNGKLLRSLTWNPESALGEPAVVKADPSLSPPPPTHTLSETILSLIQPFTVVAPFICLHFRPEKP